VPAAPLRPASGLRSIAAKSVFSGSAFWVSLILVVAVLVVYAPVRQYGFVTVDDPIYVSSNPTVSGGLTWSGLAWAFTTGFGCNWHPVTWLSHMLDVQIYGMNAGLQHVTNVFLHVANTLLLFWLLIRMTGAIGRSAFVAGLFALHPLHVESVAWIAERKDVLSTLFWMLTILAYVAYVRRPRLIRYLLVLVLFVLGLMAKPMLVTLPFVLLLLDVWPLKRVALTSDSSDPSASGSSRRAWLRLIVEKAPLLVLAAASSVVTYIVQQRGGAVNGNGIIPFPWNLRVVNAVTSYIAYIGKMLWPARLAALYPCPRSISVWGVIGACLVLAGVSVAVVWMARRRPYLIVGWLWYLGTLVPVLGLIQVGDQSMADRYTYVPLIGLFIMVAWGASDACGCRPSWQRAMAALAAIALIGCGISARAQVQTWESSTTLWEHTLAVTKNNYFAQNALGAVLVDQGQNEQAVAHLSEALRLEPAIAQAHLNLGIALARQGKMDEAMRHFSEALRLQPEFPEAQNSLGLALARRGQVSEAIAHYTEALRLRPNFADAHRNLGQALADIGKPTEAISQFTEALRLDPNLAEAHNNLGLVLAGLGRVDEAIAHYTEALRLRPDFVEAHYNLGLALASQGKNEAAIAQFYDTLRLRPDLEVAHYNLGLALVKDGNVSEAIQEFSEALRINPQNEAARRALEVLLKK
jgi:Flp pilus assembly protein TadD